MSVDYEKLGVFYLGREYDLTAGEAKPDLLLYDSKDLTTHAVIVGMTGSGKTGLGISLLEEAAIDQIPAIIIDPKGDLGNLLLTFPNLEPADFRPWVEKQEAARKGMDEDEFAAKLAETWRKELADWGQTPERIQRFRDAAEIAVYTPGSDAGLPISVLKSLSAPPEELRASHDAMRERVASAASGLLALLGVNADPLRSREHIFLSNILDHAWREGRSLEIAELIREIQTPPFKMIGVMDVDAIFPASDRLQLAMTINNLLASPGFAAWTHGEPLDVQRLLYTPDGKKTRLSIVSIAHLSENERMFFVTILLNEVITWMRAQPGTSSLRALVYMDEVFGYLPPTANPPSKAPMLTLLKQARAYGVGLVLATQNPVDLDYKALSNAGTWFLGRLQTERDKARVLDGLEGASTSAGQSFDRAATERILSGLGSRVFLMNNVHEDRPEVFQTRWALSYLRGPLTREQIGRLMADRKAGQTPLSSLPATTGSALGPTRVNGGELQSRPPILPPDVAPVYVAVSRRVPREAPIVYRSAVLGRGRLHYVDSKAGLDSWRKFVRLKEVGDVAPAELWEEAQSLIPDGIRIEDAPASEATYGSLPVELTRAKSYAGWGKSLKESLYRSGTLTLFCAPELKEFSRPEETEGDFRGRLIQKVREMRDVDVEKLRRTYGSKIATLQERIQRAEHRKETEETQAKSAKMSAAVSFGATVLGALFGRKMASSTNVGKAATSIRAAGRAMEQGSDVGRAEEKLSTLQAQLADHEKQLEADIASITERRSVENLKLEAYEVSPRKSDITVDQVTLAWLPYTTAGEPAWDTVRG